MSASDLVLLPLDGQPLPPLRPAAGRVSIVGRGADCELQLDLPIVSRKHARIARNDGAWTIIDEASRHGTWVDGVRIEPGVPTPLKEHSVVAFGPSRFRVSIEDEEAQSLVSIADESGGTTGGRGTTLRRVADAEIGALAKRRLDALVDVSAAMQSAAGEEDVALAALDAAVRGTGFSRATWVRPRDAKTGALDVLGAICTDGSGPGSIAVSRSVLQAAKDGGIVRLEDHSVLQEAVSVVASGTTSALCVPVTIGREVDSFLYLATGQGGRPPQPDAAAFCAALGRFCGLAVANLRRRKLEEQQRLIHRELEQARDVQRRFMPPERGTAGPLRFAVHAQPGRFVAGDMVGVRETSPDRAMAYIGDVTGKGMGPGMLMSVLQSYLDAVSTEGSLAEWVQRAGRHFARYASDDRFVTFWVCHASRGECRLEVVDAGHGLAVVVRGSEPEVAPLSGGGPPLGVIADFHYEASSIELQPRDRLVLFTDGVTEQPDATGEQFGIPRLLDALRGSTSPEEDVQRVREAVERFSGGGGFADDLTVASLTLIQGE